MKFFLFVATVVLWSSASIRAEQPEREVQSVAEIIEQTKERMRLFDSFSVDYTTVGGSNLTGKLPKDEINLQVIRSGDKVRIERSQQEHKREYAVFDGQNVTVLSGYSDNEFSSAVIVRDKAYLPWSVPIDLFIQGQQDESFLTWLNQASIESQSNTEVVLVDDIVTDDGGMQFQRRFWVSKDIGFPVLRRVSYVRFAPTDSWLINAEMTVDEYETYAGFSIPVKGKYRLFMFEKSGDAGKLVSSFDVHMVNWKLPAAETSHTFEVTIPENVTVDDKVNGIVYLSRRTTESDIKDTIESARFFENRSFVRVVVICLLVVGVLLLFFYGKPIWGKHD